MATRKRYSRRHRAVVDYLPYQEMMPQHHQGKNRRHFVDDFFYLCQILQQTLIYGTEF
jgi:hypothetical protein